MEPTSSGERTPVLIIGAGPVGLIAALRLREQGVAVRIIDAQTAETKRTYPVVLHPSTLRTLASLGLSAPLEWRGRSIRHLVVYADDVRRTVLDLPSAEEVAAGAMTLPQDVLRKALMNLLSSRGAQVEWQTRLVALEQSEGFVRARLTRRERVEGEPPALKLEWADVVDETAEAEFLIGADGIHSSVRQSLGIAMVPKSAREAYVFYDAPDQRAGDEAHLILGEYPSSIYPLHGNLSRFSFRVAACSSGAPGVGELRELLASRMPWYGAAPTNIEWSGSAEFSPEVAASFGERRIWLAGDAAHSTGPLGAQSLNIGIQEGDQLARRLAANLIQGTGPLGWSYAEQRGLEWQRLFGMDASHPRLARAPVWLRQSLRQLVSCLPVSGDDLDDVLQRLIASSA